MYNIFGWLSLAVGVFLVLTYVHRKRFLRMPALTLTLPGPRGLPFFGNAFQLNRSRPYETFSRWSAVYGDVYKCRIFGQTIVVLGSVETIAEALFARGRDFAGRPKMFFRAAFMSDSCQDIVSASPSPAWAALRKTVQREMKRFDPGLDRLEHLTGTILDEMTEDFSGHRGQNFDPRELIYNAVMDINCLFLVGEKFARGGSELGLFKRLERLITTSMSVAGKGFELDAFPWLRFFGNRTFEKLREAKQLRDELYNWLKRRTEDDLSNGRTGNGVVHGLFSALASGGKAGLITETNVKLAIVNLLIAGSSATTSYLYLIVNVLSRRPRVQERLRREIDLVVGGDRRVCLADRDSMPYARACLLELLRYGSLSPVLIPHRTVVDTRIRGHDIPAGVQVFLNIRSVHHDPSFWKDPYDFRPERFLDAASGCLLPPDDDHRKRVMSFGGGPRACPGESLAMSRMFLAVATIVQKFVIEVPVPADVGERESLESCDPRTYELGLVLNPRDYTVRLISRDDGSSAFQTNDLAHD